MTRRIRILPDAVANQIAAGEVVERPASVVKELVENALDASAGRVEIHVERGGKRRIRVADDGIGMSREDALLSLDRHATSKIRQAEDLQGVRSFGFRGEALPSIAAVCRMRLETRDDDDVGTAVRVSGGAIQGVEDCARQRGTTVDVQALFFNAPARGKFLKTVVAEGRAVSEAVTVLALAHPGVAFVLRSDDRTVLELPAAADLTARVAQIWGDEAAATLIPVRGSGGGLEVRGLVQRPDAADAGVRRAYLYVNGRPFRDPALVKAVESGYRTTIPAGARPWLFVDLSVADGSVDVNVHPAKAEVRFRDAVAVREGVERAVREALSHLDSSAAFGRAGTGGAADPRAGAFPDRVRERASDPRRQDGGSGSPDDQMALFVSGDAAPDSAPRTGTAEADAGAHAGVVPGGRPRLWQALRTYILAETRDGLLIIDQHSAHERVLFERLMKAFEAGGQDSQRLLFPVTLRLTPQEVEQVEALSGILLRAGFEVDAFGGDTVILQGVPNPHPWFEAERCFREMIAELTEGSELIRSAKNQHERIAMTFACKGAIKAGQPLEEREMLELFEALFATELPVHDVHGRPTVVRLSSAELERRFGRH
ncbi:MAG TPA: DNA mismatch repair endonuclease MutL [Longimicrobiales bacterium]|jgi:DNA mismatch repair protein MutL